MNRKLVVVTGVSRQKGIGRAICVELAKRGFDIFFTYWMAYDNQMPWKVEENEPDLIQQEIRDCGVKCEQVEIDLSSEKGIDVLWSTIKNTLGDPLVLVNNATYSTQTTIHNLTAEELDKHYAINIKATTLLSLKFIRQFKFNKNGRIINLTSGQSLGAMPDEIAYAITKGAIETLTHTLASKIASKGITINAVNPGPNDTGWMDEKMKAELIHQFPMNRLGTPKDTAKLVGFLAS